MEYYLANGIAPRKTLNFDIFDEKVSVTLTYNSELEEVFILKTTCLKKCYYRYEKLVADLKRLFDALKTA